MLECKGLSRNLMSLIIFMLAAGIVGKHSRCGVFETIWQIINKYLKEKWAQN